MIINDGHGTEVNRVIVISCEGGDPTELCGTPWRLGWSVVSVNSYLDGSSSVLVVEVDPIMNGTARRFRARIEEQRRWCDVGSEFCSRVRPWGNARVHQQTHPFPPRML